jgi:hypothetical protein
MVVSGVAGCGKSSSSSDGGGGASGSAGGASGGSGGGAAACAFAYSYTVVDWSGPDSNDTMTLNPPSSFHYQGDIAALIDGGQVFPSCDPPMPACNDPARIDVSDVEAAAANADVQAAFAMTTGPRFGDIGTLTNFRIFGLSRSDGRGMIVGVDCPTSAGSCTPIPPGIKAFVALLDALVLQQRADPACAGVH